MATSDENTSGSDRNKYRDNDDERDQISAADRNSATMDTKSEARGDARANVGNHTPSTTDAIDDFDRDLQRDNQRGKEPHGMEELARETRSGMFGAAGAHGDTGHTGVQHARKGQAESPAERTHNEPPKHKEGHH